MFHPPKGDPFSSLGGKFQPYLISWGSCKIATGRKGQNRKELEGKMPLCWQPPWLCQEFAAAAAEQPALPPPPPAASVNTQGLLRRLEGERGKRQQSLFCNGEGLRHQVTGCSSRVGFRLLSAPCLSGSIPPSAKGARGGGPCRGHKGASKDTCGTKRPQPPAQLRSP